MGKIFGTDGIRGKANIFPMTPEMALLVGKAVAHVFGSKRPKIVIGKDTRLSGYMFESALTAGAVSMGADVYLVGPLPTPAIAHLTKSLGCDAGIVLTASHNPPQDNGIKIFGSDGYKLPDKIETEIEKLLLTAKISSEHVQGDKVGKAYRLNEAKGRYIEYAKATVNSMSLKGLKIVIDCANGAAYDVAPKIFKELGAEIIILCNEPDGLNINYECGALHPDYIATVVENKKADIGIALDGDADRLIICDEKGNIVTGDHILAIAATELKKKNKLKNNAIVATVMSNLGLDEAMKNIGVNVIRTNVGDRYVIEEMKKRGIILGGENSGHMIFSEYATTGDGIISALQLLKIMKKSKKKVSELASMMKEFPTIMINIAVKEKKDLDKIKGYKEKLKEINKKLKGRTLIRYSGTENLCRVFVEGEDEKEIKQYAEEMADIIRKEVGK